MQKKHKEGYSILFIADKQNLWYLNGVLSLGNTFDNTLSFMSSIIKEHNIKIIFTVGGSMGGFAAMLYGSLLNANYVLATGVDYCVNAPGTYSKKMKTSVKIDEQTDKSYWDLIPYLNKNSKTIYNIIVGSLSAIDSYSAKKLMNASSQVLVYTLPDCAHSVPVGLLQKNCISVVFDSYFTNKTIENKCDLISGLVHPGEVLEEWYKQNFLGKKYNSSFYLEMLEKYPESGFTNFLVSKVYDRVNDHKKVELYLKKAISCKIPYGISN